MANLPDKPTPDFSKYLPARKTLVEDKLTELKNAETPTIGQLLDLMLEEDQALLKLAQSDTAERINLFSIDDERVKSQIADTDAAFRAQVINPDIAPEKILAATSSYRDSLTGLEAQRLKVSKALEELDLQAQQLKSAKLHSGKLKNGLNAVIEKVGDRPISPTVLAALFGLLEKPPVTADQTVLVPVDLDKIALEATVQMASLHTRTDDKGKLGQQIVARLQERRKYQTITMPPNLDLNQMLLEKGVDLARLEKETGKPMLKAHIVRTMPKFIATDLRLELSADTINEALELMANDAITTEDLKGRESLSILIDALKANAPAPAKIEEITPQIIEELKTSISEPKFTAQPQEVFSASEPTSKKTKLDLALLTDALTFDRHGKWKSGDLVSFSEIATDQRLSKEQGPAGNRRRDRQQVFAEVQTDFSTTVGQVIKMADRIGAQTIEQILNNKALEIPETQRQKLLPFAAVPVNQLPRVLEAIKMHGGISNKFKPVDQQSLLKFLLPEEKTK